MCFDIFNLLSDFSFSFGHPFEFDHIRGGGVMCRGTYKFVFLGSLIKEVPLKNPFTCEMTAKV